MNSTAPPRSPAPIAAVLIAATLLLLAGPVTAEVVAATITVQVSGLRNGAGQVLCKIFDSDTGWPASDRTPIQRAIAPIEGRSAACVFRVPPGRYAVAVAHDENRNRALDTNLVGIPKEGFGFSAGAEVGAFGPPDFEDALFTAPPGRSTQRIRMDYP